MKFNCSNCGENLEIGVEFAGGSAQCPFCLVVVGVPERVKGSVKKSVVFWSCVFVILLLAGATVFHFLRQPEPSWKLVAKKAEWAPMLGIAPGMGIDVRDRKIQPPEAPSGYEFYSDFDTIVVGRDQVFAWKPVSGRLLIVTCGLNANGVMPDVEDIQLFCDHKPVGRVEGLAVPHLELVNGRELNKRLAQTRLATNEQNFRFIFRIPEERLVRPNKSELRVVWREGTDRLRSLHVPLASLTISNDANTAKVSWNTNFVNSFKETLGGANGQSTAVWNGESFAGVDSPMKVKDGEPVLVEAFKPIIPGGSRIKNASDAKYLFVPFLRLVRVGEREWSYELRPVEQKEIKLNYGAVDNDTSEYLITSDQIGQELKPGKPFMPQQEFDVRNREAVTAFKFRLSK